VRLWRTFFYSFSLGYFENIPVQAQALDEGRGSLQPLCLETFSNGFLFEEMNLCGEQALH
jgi:hypothetical protein